MLRNEVGTFYDTLGVTSDVSPDDLRKAWLALARKHHPDRTGGHKGSEDKLKAVNEAYDTLKRPEKRRAYDAALSTPFQSGAPHHASTSDGRAPFNGSDRAADFSSDDGYADFFGDLFGRRAPGSRRGPQAGGDLETEVSITLRNSATGMSKSFRIPSAATCAACLGSGTARGTSAQLCPQCHGEGHISAGRGSLFEMSQVCPRCRGRGKVILTPCPTCGGSGTTPETRTVSIAIPAGVKAGTRLRLAGQGEPGEPGATAGDLIVVVRVQEDALFRRKKNDLLCDVPITYTQAVLGGRIDVPTLRGKAQLTIPVGTQSGTTLRMRGLGFPPFNGGHGGDQLVRVLVEVPVRLTERQMVAVKALQETPGIDSYPRHFAFASHLKHWFKG